jgi:hypothetical protein
VKAEEVRSEKLEVRSEKREIGSGKSAMGSQQWEVRGHDGADSE